MNRKEFIKGTLMAAVAAAARKGIFGGGFKSGGHSMNRLDFLKAILPIAAVSAFAEAAPARKAAVVFYSWSGNTREFARAIGEATGADVFELEPKTKYSDNYGVVVKQAKRELEEQYKPPLNSIPDVSKYTAVFLGTPNWWGTMSSPVRTFVASGALDGKRVIPFITHRAAAGEIFRRILKRRARNPKSQREWLSGAIP